MFSSSIMAMSFIFTLVRQNIEKFNKKIREFSMSLGYPFTVKRMSPMVNF